MPTRRPLHRFTAVALTAFTATAVSAGCGGAGHDSATGHNAAAPAASAGDAAHNQADVTFAQDMIVHHQQAVEMAELGEARAAHPEVKALAATIESAQQPEIDEMTTWLAGWGVPTAASHGGHHMPGASAAALPGASAAALPGASAAAMPGMMSDDDMASLRKARGAAFDTMFLDMMIRHHQGALEMATAQELQGRNAAAKALATHIKDHQTAEIAQMQTLLGKL